MEDGIGYPIPRREGSYYGYPAAELTDINDADRVSIMNYIFDETNWSDFMSDFVGEIENNRELGWRLGMGEVLYELGDREFSEDRVNRCLCFTIFVMFAEKSGRHSGY
ncbi:hypothetical protein Tco_0101052 [Tanacetum coccineum]